MKKFLFLIALFTLMGGANSVKAEKVYADLSKLSSIGTNATWDGESNTITWVDRSNNMISNFDFETGDYSSWEKVVVNITSLNNAIGVRIQIRAGGVDKTKAFNGTGKLEVNLEDFGFEGNALKSVEWIRMLGSGWYDGESHNINSTTPGSAVIAEVYFERPDDPLALPKENLSKAITKGNIQSSFAKTPASFATLTSAISAGETEYSNPSATVESLNAATKAINDAIDGLVLLDGYTNLTKDMYKTWDSATEPTEGTDASESCIYVLNESTGQPYGDGNVKWYHYADISDFTSLIILAPAGTPRVMMNRAEGEPDGGDYVEKKDAPVDGKVSIDLTAYDYAHMNAIKGANWANVTVTDMLLYRTLAVGSTGYATFGSLYKNAKPNGVTAYAAKYEGGQVTLTPVTNVPAGKGVVIMGDEDSYAPTFDVEADDIDSDLKVSNGTVVGDGSTIYVLNKVADKVGFYLLKSGKKLEAGKAYLKIDGAGSARAFIGISGMDVTGISTVKQAEGKKDDVIYNLNGQRVSNPRKGLFIKNGVKFLAD